MLMPTMIHAQSTLPVEEYRFKGVVGTTFQNSDPAVFPQPAKPPKGAPNILLVLLDDCGFGQFSVTGGGVPAPNMEKLYSEGLPYNRFHTTALCSPSRAALVTGRNHNVAGTGIITELATGYDGYTGIIPKSTATVAEILRQHGYATAWIGKNHNTPVYEVSALGPFDHWPNGLGFEYFYGFMAGDINQFLPDLFENRTPVERPDNPNYSLSADFVITRSSGSKKRKPCSRTSRGSVISPPPPPTARTRSPRSGSINSRGSSMTVGTPTVRKLSRAKRRLG